MTVMCKIERGLEALMLSGLTERIMRKGSPRNEDYNLQIRDNWQKRARGQLGQKS